MAALTWGPALEVGFGDIDVQHRRLIDLLNQLAESNESQADPATVGRIVDEVVRYTKLHFAFEEKLMERHGIPDSDEHRAEHASLAEEAADYQRRFRAGEPAVATELTDFLNEWLRHHILGTDVELARRLNELGVESAAKSSVR